MPSRNGPMNEPLPDHDINDVSDRDAHIYATTKLAAAAVLSASFRRDMVAAYNLAFVGAAYTTATSPWVIRIW